MTRSMTCRLAPVFALLAGLSLETATARADDAPPPDASPASAEMLKSMREKGILSEEEYEDIYRRQAMYEAKQREENSLPGWVKGWSVGGDLRLRLERQSWRDNVITPGQDLTPGPDNVDVNSKTAMDQRDRARIRFRIGAEKEMLEGLDVGFRIATSTTTTFGAQSLGSGTDNFSTVMLGDPRSTNTTLGDFFSPKGIFLDRAYLRYTPSFARSLSVTAGKIPNPFVSGNFPDTLVWDPDINPEGAAATYHFDWLPEYLWTDTRGGYFFVNEVGSVNIDTNGYPTNNVVFSDLPTIDEHDPYMYAVQQEITAEPYPWLRMGGRASYYDMLDINTKVAAAAMSLGNTGDAISQNPLYILLPGTQFFTNGRSNGRMQQIVIDGYFTWNQLGDRWQVTPFVQWSILPNAHNQDQMFSAGATFGDAELLKLTVMWAKVEANGTNALFTDSDIFDGFTNAKGWYIAAERKLTKSVRLRAAYMSSTVAHEPCSPEDAKALGKPLAYCSSVGLVGGASATPSNATTFFESNLSRYRVQLDLIADF